MKNLAPESLPIPLILNQLRIPGQTLSSVGPETAYPGQIGHGSKSRGYTVSLKIDDSFCSRRQSRMAAIATAL